MGVLSVEGVVLEANQKSLDFAGLRHEEVIGCDFWDAPWWRHSPELQQRLHKAIASAAKGTTIRFDATCPRTGGDMATLDFSLRPIVNDAGQVVFLVTESHDITEQRSTEDEARPQKR